MVQAWGVSAFSARMMSQKNKSEKVFTSAMPINDDFQF